MLCALLRFVVEMDHGHKSLARDYSSTCMYVLEVLE